MYMCISRKACLGLSGPIMMQFRTGWNKIDSEWRRLPNQTLLLMKHAIMSILEELLCCGLRQKIMQELPYCRSQLIMLDSCKNWTKAKSLKEVVNSTLLRLSSRPPNTTLQSQNFFERSMQAMASSKFHFAMERIPTKSLQQPLTTMARYLSRYSMEHQDTSIYWTRSMRGLLWKVYSYALIHTLNLTTYPFSRFKASFGFASRSKLQACLSSWGSCRRSYDTGRERSVYGGRYWGSRWFWISYCICSRQRVW